MEQDYQSQHSKRLLTDIATLFRTDGEKFYDVLLHCSDDQVVGYSSLILGSLSPLIKSAITSSTANDGEFPATVLIPDLKRHHLEDFLINLLSWEPNNVKPKESWQDVIETLGIQGAIFEKNISAKSEVSPEDCAPPQSDHGYNLSVKKTPKVKKTGASKPFKCSACDKTFSSNKFLRRHMRTNHSEANPFTCSVCEHRCRSKSELEVHMRSHTKEKPYACQFCDKSFTQIGHFNDHMKKDHGTTDSSNVCEICGLVLGSISAVKKHIKIHEKPDVAETRMSSEEEEEHVENSEQEKSAEQPKQSFKCDTCGKLLSSLHALRYHMVSHTGEKPFKCEQCEKSFSQKSHLTVHMRTVHKGMKHHMCSKCGKRFSVGSNLRKHLLTHDKDPLEAVSEEQPVLEPESGDVWVVVDESSEVKIQDGVTTVDLQIKHLVCEFCGRTFVKESELQLHVKTHTHSRPYQCSYCHEVFSSRSALKIHEKTHTGEFQHVCQYCQTVCLTKSSLNKHVLIHTGDKPHECPECKKRFRQKSQMTYHVKMVHGPDKNDRPRNHVCYQCGQRFTTNSGLTKHVKIHTNDRPHKCDDCGKSFIQRTHLKTHKLKHTGERPYQCSECGKSFYTAARLKDHGKIHTGEAKPSVTTVCTVCGAQYSNVSDMKIHMRRHSGETPFHCSYCSKSFRAKRNLETHERTHTGQKPFKCQNCHKSFTAAGSLRQHFKRHDTCRLTASTGAYSIKNQNILYGPDSKETVLVDFPSIIEVTPVLVADEETTLNLSVPVVSQT